ncbi:MAG: hypothetical protein H7146_02415 [Burkholderiaceae bacterium]|nr:hypothetical protein [Microbacteriaceae bacterium]
MKTKNVVAFSAVVGIAFAGLTLATPAYADPVSNSYVLAGSDTLQDAANALSNGTNISGAFVRVTGGLNSVGSFDAFGSAAIQTKPGGTYFARPAGSGDGVRALSYSIDGTKAFSVSGNTTPATTISGQIDIARSSSGPTPLAGGPLEYFQFGRDALSYAYVGAGLEQLTGAQLKQAYECTLTVVNGVALKPRLPNPASGTRKFFLSAIGSPTLGSCVNATETVPENDGTVLSASGEIIPFSVASWVAQSNNAAPDRTGNALIGSTQGSTAPFTGTAPSLVPNPTYYSSSFGRDTYVVVEAARVDPSNAKYDATLAGLVDRTKTKSLTNFSSSISSAGAVKLKFGFLPPASTTPIFAAATN